MSKVTIGTRAVSRYKSASSLLGKPLNFCSLLITVLIVSMLFVSLANAKPQKQQRTTHKKHIAPATTHHTQTKHAPPHTKPPRAKTTAPHKQKQAVHGKKTSAHATQKQSPVHDPIQTASNHSLAHVNTLQLARSHRQVTNSLMTSNTHTITSAQKKLVEFVDRTVYNLNYSSYRLGAGRFDTSHGIYVVDCSRFVDSILSRVYPAAYSSLVDASGADRPASQHYYHFFSDLSPHSRTAHWNKVEKIGQLRPGDILVFRYRKSRGPTQGHVMVVMDKPRAAENAWLVRVADSAPVRHSADTRQLNESGIGIGTLLLKPTPTGKPAAYAWGMGSSWRKNVKFAMARPLKMDA